jgi:hypothetical protein
MSYRQAKRLQRTSLLLQSSAKLKVYRTGRQKRIECMHVGFTFTNDEIVGQVVKNREDISTRCSRNTRKNREREQLKWLCCKNNEEIKRSMKIFLVSLRYSE